MGPAPTNAKHVFYCSAATGNDTGKFRRRTVAFNNKTVPGPVGVGVCGRRARGPARFGPRRRRRRRRAVHQSRLGLRNNFAEKTKRHYFVLLLIICYRVANNIGFFTFPSRDRETGGSRGRRGRDAHGNAAQPFVSGRGGKFSRPRRSHFPNARYLTQTISSTAVANNTQSAILAGFRGHFEHIGFTFLLKFSNISLFDYFFFFQTLSPLHELKT